MIKGFAHAALYTSDIEAVLHFYKEVFGAEDMGEFTTSCRVAWLSIGESVLEVFDKHKCPDGSFDHIALSCDDVDAQYEKCLAAGAQEDIRPKNISLALNEPVNARIAFVRGLAGERIELFCVEK